MNEYLCIFLPGLLREVVASGLSMREHDAVACPHLTHQILPTHILNFTMWQGVPTSHQQLAVQEIIGNLKNLMLFVGYLGELGILKRETR
jgi:hypothetical protein